MNCSKCGKEKPLSEFHKYKRVKDGRKSECKQCIKARSRKYRTEHADEIKARARRYRAEHRAEHAERRADYQLQYTFGITLADYDRMLEVQGGGCAICGMTPEENKQRLAVDHNHETDVVRGLLCQGCNLGLGHFCDSLELTRAAALYLEQHKEN